MACEGEGLSPRDPLPSAGNKKAGITHLRETPEGRSTNRPKAWGQRGVKCEPRMPPSAEEGTGTPLHHNRHVSTDKGNSSGRMGSQETHKVVREDRDGGREGGDRD